MTASPRIRLLALGALVAAVALGAGFLLLASRQGSSNAAVPKIHPLYAHRRHHVRRAHKQAIVRHVVRKHIARRVARGPAVIDGMPAALARSLGSHRVVVVALYAPRSGVDQLALAEARAGAAAAGAGFVGINVMADRETRPLTQFLASVPNPADRILDDPAVLVVQQPKTLFVRLNGFADRDSVAQAVANARG